MNTALKTNVYHFPSRDNERPKSGQQIKKEMLLDKLSKAIRLKHYSKATERAYAGYVAEFIDFRIGHPSHEHGAKAIEEYLNVAFNASTMIYTHVMQKKSAVRSPLDRMFRA